MGGLKHRAIRELRTTRPTCKERAVCWGHWRRRIQRYSVCLEVVVGTAEFTGVRGAGGDGLSNGGIKGHRAPAVWMTL
jgi:hypothetical protein